MGGFVVRGGQVERINITPEKLEEIARALGIAAPEQVQSISLAVTRRPPSEARPSATRGSRRRQE
jgi:hypothetical protein